MKFDLWKKYPEWIEIKKSNIINSWMWAYTKIDLKKNIVIWEYIWKKCSSKDFDNKWKYIDYWFSVRKWHKVIFVLDAANKKNANWTRYVNCARHNDEENVTFYQYRQRIFIKTIKPISAWTELLIWYWYEYGEKLLWYNIYD